MDRRTEKEETDGKTLERYLRILKLYDVNIVRAQNYDGSTSSIINIDNKHWVAVWINRRGRRYYFDSGGHPPPKKWNIHRWNRIKLQPKGTRCCGWYCLWFLFYAKHKLPVERLIGRPLALYYYIRRVFRVR